MIDVLNDFVIKARFPVSWGDMDAMNHVNNTVFLKYFENARIKYYDAIGLTLKQNAEIFGVVKSINCEFILPVTYPDIIEAGTRVVKLEQDRFTMEHYILTKSMGIVAFGETEIAMVSRLTNKPVDIPAKIIKSIKKIEQNRL